MSIACIQTGTAHRSKGSWANHDREGQRAATEGSPDALFGGGIAVVKKGMDMPGKYTPLENYLRDLPENQKEVTLRFEEIEMILNSRRLMSPTVRSRHDASSGSKLPQSAYEDRRWWDHETEGNHISARSWSNAGWKIESLDVDKKWVKFVRAE